MIPLKTIINDNSPEIQEQRLIDSLCEFAYNKQLTNSEINNIVSWVLRFTRFHNRQHPSDLNHSDIETFISLLATEHNYAHTTQLKAVEAINFLYRDFLKINLDTLNYVKLKRRHGFIDRFGNRTCFAVLNNMNGCSLLMSKLALLGNLKLKEVVNLKLSDINIKGNTISVRKDNGEIKFTLNIPFQIILDLRIQLMRVRQLLIISQNKENKNSQINLLDQEINQKQPKDDGYLFSLASQSNPISPSRVDVLAVLKNDIRIASRQYLRFAKIQKSISMKVYSDQRKTDSIKPDAKSQTCFNFPPSQKFCNRFSEQIKLGAA